MSTSIKIVLFFAGTQFAFLSSAQALLATTIGAQHVLSLLLGIAFWRHHMDPSQSEQLQTFMSVTGASEAVAWDKLQAHRGDLNAAINSFFNEGENPVPPVQSQAADRLDWMEEDEPPSRQPIVPPSYLVPLAPAWASADAIPPRFPFRGTVPIVSQPRDVREVPIDWRDEEQPRVRSLAGPQIEEIPETENAHLSLQSHVHFISDDDEVSGPASAVVRAGSERPSPFGSNNYGEFLSGNENLNAPSINEVPAMANNEGHDIEEEMLRAAIEASRKEATGTMGPAFAESLSGARVDGAGMRTEDDDLAWAVSQSLKTAEQEKAMREGKGYPGFPEEGFLHEDENNYPRPENCENRDIPKRKESSSARGNYSGESGTLMKSSLPPDYPMSDIPVSHANTVSKDPVVDVDEFEEPPLLRRRSGRGLNPTLTPPSEIEPPAMPEMHQGPSDTAGVPAHPSASFERNGDVTQNDEWGGLSSEEQEEAVMLEAAMFGSLPEDSALRFRYPSVVGGIVEDADGNLSDDGQPRNYARPIRQPPSPTVIAQRRLREQQDDEYLASLEADREKEARAQLEEEARRMKEEEDKAAAHEEEKLWQEEDLRKRLAEEELERQIAAKRAALPKEPSIDDESAVTLMVRMPDGSRQGRRFHKSEPLQCLFDFVDVSGGVVPGSYRLVRQYPRKVFTDAEHGNSLYDLGLSSKYEALFLELI